MTWRRAALFLFGVLIGAISTSAGIIIGVNRTTTTNTMKITQVQDAQTEKTMWDICTPKGWVQINTSAPVHIWWTPTDIKPDVPEPFTTGPYLLGPYSPSQTFSAPWDEYPKEKCG